MLCFSAQSSLKFGGRVVNKLENSFLETVVVTFMPDRSNVYAWACMRSKNVWRDLYYIFVYLSPNISLKKLVGPLNCVGFQKVYTQKLTNLLRHSCTDRSNVYSLFRNVWRDLYYIPWVEDHTFPIWYPQAT